MAEYMDIARIDDWNDFSIIDDNGYATFVNDVDELPRADVVERAEYDKMVKSFQDRNENLKQNLINTRDSYLKLEKEITELEVNIDKAIKEIEVKRDIHEKLNNPWGDATSYKNPYEEVLQILKRNIGK